MVYVDTLQMKVGWFKVQVYGFHVTCLHAIANTVYITRPIVLI